MSLVPKTGTRFNELVNEAVAHSFSGWDFSFVADRITESEPGWDYRRLVEQKITSAHAMVDLCTGGGEFLDGFKELPNLTYATEAFAPNIEVARQRLAKRGVNVVACAEEDELLLPDHTFDLVINRHGAYAVQELRRITKPGATFLTQQVGSSNAIQINEALHAPVSNHARWNLATAIEQLTTQGFSICRNEEAFPSMSFHDIGALVYYLRAIPWQIADFKPEDFLPQLQALHQQIENEGPFEVATHRFLIEAMRD